MSLGKKVAVDWVRLPSPFSTVEPFCFPDIVWPGFLWVIPVPADMGGVGSFRAKNSAIAEVMIVGSGQFEQI